MSIVDCDIHNAPVSEASLLAYMPERWRRARARGGRLDAAIEGRRETLGDRSYLGAEYPEADPTGRPHRLMASERRPARVGSRLHARAAARHVRDRVRVLTPMLGAGEQLDIERGAALASAINDWQIAEWLEPEPRLRASINIAYEDGELSAAEIHRRGDDSRFVQVLMLIRTAEPMGRRRYWPIYEAAAAHGIPVGVHFGGWGRGPITGAGFPSFYIEDTVGMATAFQDQLTSLVCEGVFERFPTLRLVLIEGGIAWMAALMWRMDRAWKLLRDEAPRLQRLPSEVIREHVWLTTQPIDEPGSDAEFAVMLDQIGMTDHIMFSTDYPHWDFDAPDRALPRSLSQDVRRAILHDNAHRCYRLRAGETTGGG